MKNRILTLFAALGLFAGGLVIGQAFESDSVVMRDYKASVAEDVARQIYGSYVTKVESAKSSAQVSQVVDEASIRMQLLQIKQNAEIIRLLTELNKKK